MSHYGTHLKKANYLLTVGRSNPQRSSSTPPLDHSASSGPAVMVPDMLFILIFKNLPDLVTIYRIHREYKKTGFRGIRRVIGAEMGSFP